MTKRLAGAVALVLVGATGGRAADLDVAARDAVARREFAAAGLLYARLAVAHPDDLDYVVWQARLASWLEEYAEADALYDRVLARDPDHGDALVGKASVASWDRRYDEADRWLEHAERAHPGSADVAEVRRRNDEARRWRSLSVEASHVEATVGGQVEHFSYTDTAYMGFVRGRYRPGRVRYFLEVQEWDKFAEQSTRVGAGMSMRIVPKWPMSLEAWIDPGSDVMPQYDFRVGIGRVLPWRFGVGLDYRFAQFSDSHFQVASATIEYYLPFPAWVTATYHQSFTASDLPGLDGSNNAYSFRYHHQIIPPVTIHAGYARGGETYADLSIDQIGHFEANTVEAAVDVAITPHWSARLGGVYQSRDNGDTVTGLGTSVSYHWQ